MEDIKERLTTWINSRLYGLRVKNSRLGIIELESVLVATDYTLNRFVARNPDIEPGECVELRMPDQIASGIKRKRFMYQEDGTWRDLGYLDELEEEFSHTS